MPTLEVKNTSGETVDRIEIPETLVQPAASNDMVAEVVRMHQARARRGTASTRTRGDVAGSGRKPWRQKGTGRARSGDRNSPIWRGGGTVFGPHPRDYSYSVPKKVKRKALKSVLAMRFFQGRVTVLDGLALEEPKTSVLAGILEKVGAGSDVLVVTPVRDRNVHLAARNLPAVSVSGIRELNTLAVLSHRNLVVTREALEHLQEWMGKIA
ncbi:MAG TPA: 50S ribosomal protein L4 [bacterium]|nr:50S ribosomal protein L4 [bacterium]HPQ65973.1 50S ribosomal protein L4 [bacterium]